MAGTRLAVHATFIVELLVLVVASFLYASNQRHDPFSSAEPFLADKSGWKVLVEDVSPAPSPDADGSGVIDYAMECAAAMMSQIYSVIGTESEKYIVPDRPRRSSAFVQELRQKIAEFHFLDDDDNDGGRKASAKNNIFPPLKVNLSMPQVESSTIGKSFAEALERGFQSQKTSPVVRVGTAESTSNPDFNVSDIHLCDDFQPPIQSKPNFHRNHRELKFPEIIILMGCSSATIPDQQLSHVEVDRRSGIVIVRTVLTVEQKNEFQRHLEEDVSRILSSTFFGPLSNNGYRVGSVSIKLIDENPSSHVADGADVVGGFTAKVHFDTIGKALSSSVQSTIGLLLEDLSFIYGGKIEVNDDVSAMTRGSVVKTKDAISLEVHSSAYLALPDDIVELESDGENKSIKYVTSEGLANWMFPYSRQGMKSTGDVEWTLFIPSQDHTPLKVHDESIGGEGESIILSSPKLDGGRMNNAYPNGMSIVNLPSFTANVDLGQLYSSYRDEISQSLVYLVGYIRAIHGLPPSAVQMHANLSTVKYGDDPEKLSFWELESIARSHYYSSLELAFSETDVLMSLLHQHAGTLALPREVAYKLNNATHLLRQSISLVGKGFPTMYASSLLHGSLQHIQSVQNDHRFVELPYFAPDHYLAVFSPLVLPLLLPMMVGLIREVKRFRELQKRDG